MDTKLPANPRVLSRRRALGLGLGATGALALGACGGGSKTAKATSGTLSLYNDNATWKTGFIQAGQALKKLTGFDFNPLAVTQVGAYEQVVKNSITTKKTGDIAKWHEAYPLQDLARGGKLTDLSDTWNGLQAKGWVDPAVRDAQTYNGKIYGIPLVHSYWAVFYSKTLFAKAGVQAPSTYDDFLKVCTAIKKTGATPIWTGQGDGWESFIPYTALICAQDPTFYTKLVNNQASYTDPVSANALQLWSHWIANQWVTPADSKMNDAAGLMKAGKLAMMPVGTWYNGTFTQAGLKPGTDYGVFLFPPMAGVQHSTFVESSSLIVPTNAPYHDGAMKQMANWLDPSVQAGWSKFIGDFSANPKVTIDDPLLQTLEAQVKSTNATKLVRYYEASPPNLINGNIGDLAAFMVTPSKASSVLSSMQKRADTEWKAWKENS